MLASDVVRYFQAVSDEPADPQRSAAWLDGADILPFLDGSTAGDIPGYFSRHD